MKVNVINGTLTNKEQQAYVDHALKNCDGKELDELDIKLDGDFVDLTYHFKAQPFERIRRITGYLVGTLDRFNDAKRAEVEARVKHSMSNFCDCNH